MFYYNWNCTFTLYIHIVHTQYTLYIYILHTHRTYTLNRLKCIEMLPPTITIRVDLLRGECKTNNISLRLVPCIWSCPVPYYPPGCCIPTGDHQGDPGCMDGWFSRTFRGFHRQSKLISGWTCWWFSRLLGRWQLFLWSWSQEVGPRRICCRYHCS